MLRQAFLVLLAVHPAHGYELKATLDRRLGGLLPPLNDGQVYTTLGRLERDGLVESSAVEVDARGKRVYAVTPEGRREALEWLRAAGPEAKLKDEFFLKLALTASTGLGDAVALIDAQRQTALHSLRELEAAQDGDAVPALLREGLALHLQARLRWLEICEERLREERNHGGATSP